METNDILNKLKLLTRTRKEVRFVDNYKGVPQEFNATVPIVKRKTMRAQPEDAIMDVSFKYGDVGIQAELVDISEFGIGIYTKTPLRVPEKAFIYTQILDPEVSTCLKLEASCDTVNTNREEDLHGRIRYRTGMQIFPNEGTKQKITEYIFNRQVKQTYELKRYYYVHSLQ